MEDKVRLLTKLGNRLQRYESFKRMKAPQTILDLELELIDDCLVKLNYTKSDRIIYLNELITK